jgi:hypothetical protein
MSDADTELGPVDYLVVAFPAGRGCSGDRELDDHAGRAYRVAIRLGLDR